MNAPLKILGRITSINVRKVLWTCDEMGLAYEREDWGSGFRSAQSAEFLALNPNGLIPVVIDDAGTHWESNPICRYLAARHGRTDLLPALPAARATVEQWMDWQATELNYSGRYAFLALARRAPGYDDATQIETSVHQWNALIGILERHLLATGGILAGAPFTLADIVVGLGINRWLKTPIDHPDYPAVGAYFARLSGRPAFQVHGGTAIA
jgi:glutathione S-transferase